MAPCSWRKDQRRSIAWLNFLEQKQPCHIHLHQSMIRRIKSKSQRVRAVSPWTQWCPERRGWVTPGRLSFVESINILDLWYIREVDPTFPLDLPYVSVTPISYPRAGSYIKIHEVFVCVFFLLSFILLLQYRYRYFLDTKSFDTNLRLAKCEMRNVNYRYWNFYFWDNFFWYQNRDHKMIGKSPETKMSNSVLKILWTYSRTAKRSKQHPGELTLSDSDEWNTQYLENGIMYARIFMLSSVLHESSLKMVFSFFWLH